MDISGDVRIFNLDLKTMEYTVKDLEFISQINRDGKGITDLSRADMGYKDDVKFKLYSLSLTQKTHIAHGFNSYIVTIKPKVNEK